MAFPGTPCRTPAALIASASVTSPLRTFGPLDHSHTGWASAALAIGRPAAELVGLNIRSLAVVAFVGAGALCALGGSLLAPSNPMTYSSDVAITVNGFAAAVFGGLGSIRLALIGGYALGILEQLYAVYAGVFGDLDDLAHARAQRCGFRVIGPRNRDADVPELRVPQREIAERR